MKDVKLQRRHFELIADALHASMPDVEQIKAVRVSEIDYEPTELKQWKHTVSEVIEAVKQTNTNFSPQRFMHRCVHGEG